MFRQQTALARLGEGRRRVVAGGQQRDIGGPLDAQLRVVDQGFRASGELAATIAAGMSPVAADNRPAASRIVLGP
ncbi:hypothetical protein ACFYPX_17780 [Micromonospora zamorensis]|uniref:hypothetical protein n=1 Tax=Micromonospora zamorensis TaxID=709883 RepID=UPI0036A4F0BC